MKLKNIIDNVLYEKVTKGLKIFYTTDIFIREREEQPEETPPEDTAAPTPEGEATPPEGGAPESGASKPVAPKQEVEKTTFRAKSSGEELVANEKAKTILTIDDLLAYIDRQTDASGKKIINELVVEVVLALIEDNPQLNLEDLLHESDKLNVMVDYGFDKEDSIGFQITKNSGVNVASLIMRRDGSPLAGKFNPTVFNQTITNVFLKEIT